MYIADEHGAEKAIETNTFGELCGVAPNAKALGFEENGDAFNGKTGLWKTRLIPSNKKKDLCLIESALKRFASWPNKPSQMTLVEAKTYLGQFAFKVKNNFWQRYTNL